MRVLGIDFGSKRIGLAVGDTVHRIASPRPNMTPSGTLAKDAAELAARARTEEAEAIVLGIPEAEDGRMARVCNQLGDLIEQEGWTVHRIDESLTSIAADEAMAGLKGSIRRKRRDGEAACQILERYFHEAAA